MGKDKTAKEPLELVERLGREHQRSKFGTELTSNPYCVTCETPWPCAASEAANLLEQQAQTIEGLRELVRRAAEVFDCHIDAPQACSHAELRDTAKEFRAALSTNKHQEGEGK
jgi:hypothetical protein